MRRPSRRSLASAASFFGNVSTSFVFTQRIGATGNASIQTVGPDIANALVATAVGLLAAIPAVMAYNYFVNRIKKLSAHLDGFATDYLNTLRRSYFGR